ncbi:MAG TPA: hypothetical protein VMR21_04130 [Vicinamibacteria bacterium]|nr:hypothetical protein [Vicinamibacteria bacterium]
MPFAYYGRLSRRDRAVYDRSDAIPAIVLPLPEALRPMVDVLRQGLETDDRRVVEAAAQALCRAITQSLDVEPVDVGVLAVRPRLREAELHGLYTHEPGRRPRIRVWMRTVAYKRVVAFRTFLRTLLHELSHHLDYTHLGLAESFHTEGFFRRESSLFHQLVPRPEAGARGGVREPPR